jgi:hypothetical protein
LLSLFAVRIGDESMARRLAAVISHAPGFPGMPSSGSIAVFTDDVASSNYPVFKGPATL